MEGKGQVPCPLPFYRSYTTYDFLDLTAPQSPSRGADHLYFFDTYFNARSEPLGHFIARRIRTYPIHCGISTLAVKEEYRAGIR